MLHHADATRASPCATRMEEARLARARICVGYARLRRRRATRVRTGILCRRRWLRPSRAEWTQSRTPPHGTPREAHEWSHRSALPHGETCCIKGMLQHSTKRGAHAL
jgi:hypothetical protein